MLIIGEKINSTRKRIKEAIAQRDAEFLKGLALEQTQAGADLDNVQAGEDAAQDVAFFCRDTQPGQLHADLAGVIRAREFHAVDAEGNVLGHLGVWPDGRVSLGLYDKDGKSRGMFSLFPDGEVALSNAFGFGGTNCCVIFRGV